MNIKNENSSLSQKTKLSNKVIYDITKFTTTDYPNYISCIVWFCGCNMRCQYCHNPDIVFSKQGSYSFEELLEFLKSRTGLLQGVVLSGGEATLHDLELYCTEIKKLDYKIKLDTNGSNLKLIKKLIDNSLLDYIALDFKSTREKYYNITKSNLYGKWLEILEYLIEINFNFEVRTTYHSHLLNEVDIKEMQGILKSKGYNKPYYIQNFRQAKTIEKLNDSDTIILNDTSIVFR